MRVLLVEDEAAFAQTLELMLRSEAFEVVAAARVGSVRQP